MDRNTFEERLQLAAQQALKFAREFVREKLPDEMVFLVYPNQSCDHHPRVGDEVIYPGDSLPLGQYHGPWPSEQVIGFLWRNGKVPEWIDISVQGMGDDVTEMALLCCGRFTAQEELLYYPDRETRPFAVKSPTIPPGWDSPEISGRFGLYWREDRRESCVESSKGRTGSKISNHLASLLDILAASACLLGRMFKSR